MGCQQSTESEEVVEVPQNSKTVDPRLPFERYRQLFTLKNYWKSVTRSLETTAKDTLCRFFKQFPDHYALYPNLKKLNLEDQEKVRSNMAFENVAILLFNMIDQVMESLDNVDKAIEILQKFGAKHHKIEGATMQYYKDLEGPFMASVQEVLGDRFNDAAEDGFRKFYGFMLKYIEEGFESVGS